MSPSPKGRTPAASGLLTAEELDGVGFDDEPDGLIGLEGEGLQGSASDVDKEGGGSAEDAEFDHSGAVFDGIDAAGDDVAGADSGGWSGGDQDVSGADGERGGFAMAFVGERRFEQQVG